jgi:hypothetical protein
MLQLQKEGINCNLKYNNNYFSTKKKPIYYWRGLYECTNNTCKSRYKATMKEIPELNKKNIIIEINYTETECFYGKNDEIKIKRSARQRTVDKRNFEC